MDKNNNKLLLSSIVIGLLIMFSPIILTGYTYSTDSILGPLLYFEFTIRSLALIIGLLVIYDGVKNFLKK
ncbi:hypothetical protein CA600_17190 [Paenibacillus sp. VTT E-133280]|jgi:ABC-type arginine/histidine transport system permease subunit|uniref:Uncharacterized protein n=1 Tax=Paenibacillus pseudetheri TaxID=2897682 RepID=A0ABN8FN61_9BACL|nr:MULTISPECIES: hypothetical protein [Paenibacillus]MDH6371444.1 ABC-type arginine/histidine transport system permease subunit [Paenibacillus sp. PastF-3]OZQ64302.1 hypothetical protein CA600_17190 [Paenibacillus sp. VTT E-133280]OZQ90006.1 hypothetical protein CA598_13655 [Paenibacillus sp. VTT E-133291]CAH1059394.1 hypothetical protein PAECIP111894_05600 [Paenibacillus pseudetheri]